MGANGRGRGEGGRKVSFSCQKNLLLSYDHLTTGDDGKPDFYSRKACNYLEVAVEVS